MGFGVSYSLTAQVRELRHKEEGICLAGGGGAKPGVGEGRRPWEEMWAPSWMLEAGLAVPCNGPPSGHGQAEGIPPWWLHRASPRPWWPPPKKGRALPRAAGGMGSLPWTREQWGGRGPHQSPHYLGLRCLGPHRTPAPTPPHPTPLVHSTHPSCPGSGLPVSRSYLDTPGCPGAPDAARTAQCTDRGHFPKGADEGVERPPVQTTRATLTCEVLDLLLQQLLFAKCFSFQLPLPPRRSGPESLCRRCSGTANSQGTS